MKKIFPLAAAVACLLIAGVAVAGTVYLPGAMNQTIEGKQYRSLLWITNTGNQPADVVLRFIPSLVDGTEGLEEGEFDQAIIVPANSTVPVSAGLGKIGMLEARTDSDNVFYVGELNSFSQGGQKLAATSVPLIDAQNLLSAGSTAHLLALERQTGVAQTDLGLVNLGSEETDCTIRAFRPEGAQIQSTVTIPVPPLSHRDFSGAFGILGESTVDGARFEVSCADPFYAYATILSRVPDSTQFVTAAAGGGDGLIDPSATGEIARLNGQFFRSSQTQGQMSVELNVPPGVNYDSMTVEFDMQTARFPTNLFTATAQLRRGGAGGLFWAHTIRGGGRNKTLLDMGVGDGLVHQGGNGKWAENAPYHIRAHYDTVAGRIDWHVTQGNRTVERINARIGRFDLRHDGQGIDLIFGLSRAFDNAFFPPYNFRFSNLSVTGVASVD